MTHLRAAKDDVRVLLFHLMGIGEADGDARPASEERARTEPDDDEERRDRDRPDPARPPAMSHARLDASGASRSAVPGVFRTLAHRAALPATSHMRRGSKVTEATMVRKVIIMKAVAPQPASSEPSVPKWMSGTKNTMANGSVFDHRPISAMTRSTLVLVTRCLREPRQTESTHQPSAKIFTAGVRMLVQKTSAPSGQRPASKRSCTPVIIV